MASAKDWAVGQQLEDVPGLDVLSQDPHIGSGVEQNHGQIQPAGAKSTTYSLLDMDLWVDSHLSRPLIPLEISSQDGWRTEIKQGWKEKPSDTNKAMRTISC